MPVISISNLYKKFEIKRSKRDILFNPFKREYKIVLNNINLKIDECGLYSLVGPNGSGKTTLLRILSGIILPNSGEVRVFDSPARINPYQIFLISEAEKGFYPRLSLKNNLLFFASLISANRRDITRKVDEIIDEFDLKCEMNTRFQELSSGTKQRLSIARAMLFDPRILLFDEITKGIDLSQQQTIYRLIKSLKKRGKTIIFSTHIKDEIENLSDKVILLNEGKIIAFGEYAVIKDTMRQIFNLL